MELSRETSQFVMVVPVVKLIVELEGVFLHPQILIIEDALSIIVVGLTLSLHAKIFKVVDELMMHSYDLSVVH